MFTQLQSNSMLCTNFIVLASSYHWIIHHIFGSWSVVLIWLICYHMLLILVQMGETRGTYKTMVGKLERPRCRM